MSHQRHMYQMCSLNAKCTGCAISTRCAISSLQRQMYHHSLCLKCPFRPNALTNQISLGQDALMGQMSFQTRCLNGPDIPSCQMPFWARLTCSDILHVQAMIKLDMRNRLSEHVIICSSYFLHSNSLLISQEVVPHIYILNFLHEEHQIDECIILQLAHVDTSIIRTSDVAQLDHIDVESLVPLSRRLLKFIK